MIEGPESTDGSNKSEKIGTFVDVLKSAEQKYPGGEWRHYGVKDHPAVTFHSLVHEEFIVGGYIINKDGTFASPLLTNQECIQMTLSGMLADLTWQQRYRLRRWIRQSRK